ncbi:unnamed protein product [Diamesa hyperborea]
MNKCGVVDKSLDAYLSVKKGQNALKWGTLNLILLSIIVFDLMKEKDFDWKQNNDKLIIFGIELLALLILSISLFANFVTFIKCNYFVDLVVGSEQQRNLLNLDAKSFKIESKTDKKVSSPNASMYQSSFIKNLSWQVEPNTSANSSSNWFNNSANLTNQSLNAINSEHSINESFQTLNPQRSEFINDQNGLNKYLNDVETNEKNLSTAMEAQQSLNGSGFNSFWNSYRLDDLATSLKTTFYQLSPSTTPQSKQISMDESLDDKSENNSEIIRKISATKLSNYVGNLKMWIAKTILERLVCEINNIDKAFEKRGFTDMRIGAVGLERLKKTASSHQQLVQLHIPMLTSLIPYLDICSNQEFLVKRIKDLAVGSSLGNFKWQNSKLNSNLDSDHVPNDSAIIFHLFCTYLDSQLYPRPDLPRPFYNRYVVIGDIKKSNTDLHILSEINKNKSKCGILCSSTLSPKFNFISDNKIHNCAYDRNNIFYVIIQLLIHLNLADGLLEGVNLGKSGINILNIIED